MQGPLCPVSQSRLFACLTILYLLGTDRIDAHPPAPARFIAFSTSRFMFHGTNTVTHFNL